MAFSNKKIEPNKKLLKSLPSIVFDSVRSTTENTSRRNRQCYGSLKKINKGDKYINHQFRYDGRIVTVSFDRDFFYGIK